jgi:Cu/Ag efflux protein CusF
VKTLPVLLVIAAVAWLAWQIWPEPHAPMQPAKPAPTFDYGIGLVQEIDKEQGVISIQRGTVTIAYPLEDKRQLAGLRPLERIEFQVLNDGTRSIVTEIRPLDDEGDQAADLPACVSLRHSGRASLSQTAAAKSNTPPSAT